MGRLALALAQGLALALLLEAEGRARACAASPWRSHPTCPCTLSCAVGADSSRCEEDLRDPLYRLRRREARMAPSAPSPGDACEGGARPHCP
eukprot:7378226-Prymnesium_polylepis.1